MTTNKLNTIYNKLQKALNKSDNLWSEFDKEKYKLIDKYLNEIYEQAVKDFHHLKIKGTKDSYLMVNKNGEGTGFIIHRLFNKVEDKEYMESINSFEITVIITGEFPYKGQAHIGIVCHVFGAKKSKIFYDYETFKKFILKKDWITLKEIG